MDYFKAEYIWVDGTEPTPQLRSKTKILKKSLENIPSWGFDGSSTNQAAGQNSDCVLKPAFVCPDPIRGGDSKLVLCGVYNVDDTPHITNTRVALSKTHEKSKDREFLFGMEQEYTLVGLNNMPVGFFHARRKKKGFHMSEQGMKPLDEILDQGPYYCAVGAGLAVGRSVAEAHLDLCLRAGLDISGINAEVMPGQWEFQVGPVNPLEVSDQLLIARWILDRVAEDYSLVVSLDPKPAEGDWNGAGCHTNFSTKEMRNSYDECERAAQLLGETHRLHIRNYGSDIEKRLTGKHETCSYKEYRYGVSDRTASVRIPWQVKRDGKGYVEDRRPNANCDPYVVTRLIVEAVCK
jgi:glutamine synthetase